MAGQKDFLDILREVRGSAAPGQPLKDGIWYELTVADTNGNPGIYGDILAKYGIVTESAGTFDQAVAILENLNVEVTTLPAGSDATSALVNGVWQIGLPRGINGIDGNDGSTPEVTMAYDSGNLKYTVTVDGVIVTNTNLLNLDTLVDSKVSTNVGVHETLEAKQEVIDKVNEAQGLVDNLNQSVITKKQEITDLTDTKKQEIIFESEFQSELVRDVGEEVTQEFDEHALLRTNQYNSNHNDKLNVYNINDTIKMLEYNANHIERLENINYAYADRIVEMIKTRNFMGILDEYVPKTATHMITFLDTTDANYIYYANGTLLVEDVDYTVYDSTTIELTVKANPYDVIVQVNTQILADMLTSEGVLFEDRIGQPNGVAGLNEVGQVPAEQLPSYVDDVLEFPTYADLPVEGEPDKIYIVIEDETSNGDTITYRWTGTTYAMVSNTLNASDIKALYEANPDTNAYTDAEKSKLANIEDGATADQTADEILTLLKTVDGSGSELDADLLDGQEGAYYLDASNINAGTLDDARLPDTITSDITGNAATATKLATARAIGGVSFDGTADISLPGVDIAGNQDTTGNASTATKLATAVTIALAGDVSGNIDFDGSANVTIETTVQPNSVALGTDTTGNYVVGNTAGTGITISGTAGEGWSPTIAIADVGTAGTYTKVTTNAQGQVTAGATLSATDIPELDASKITSGVIDAARLPSYVDDVLEFSSFDDFPLVGETGKIYVAIDTNKTYRWSGTSYVYITSGAVDSVAGKTGVVILNKNDVGLDQVDNTSDADKPISTATVNALALKANIESPALTGVPTAPTAAIGDETTQIATTAFVGAEIADQAYSKTQLDAGQLDDRYYTETELLDGALDSRYYTETEIDTKLAEQNDANEISYDGAVSELVATNVQDAIDEVESRLDVVEGVISETNLTRADKYLAAQSVVKMIYNPAGKLSKVRYNNDTDVDYEVLTYNLEGKLTNVAHYVESILRGNTTLSYENGKLVAAPYTAV